ncbi:MAG: FMN-binding negative transcriptional regulator [Parvularculaceae bacterium]|nr:FMN-binding negative transcriptional regulator [Parvularculaceae bacterium]
MHVPTAFRPPSPDDVADLIRMRPLATLVVNGQDGPIAAHAPLAARFSDDGRLVELVGHVARANPFWRAADGAVALAIFSGPDAYVSPGYYPSKADHGRVVPTWNYCRVEARGPVALIENPECLRAVVERLTAMMETPRAAPWSVDDAPEDYVKAMLGAIVGLRIDVVAVDGAWKFSQNKNAGDRAGVAAGLLGDGHDAVAALTSQMARMKP